MIEYDAAAGNGFCVQCGTVVEENTIVSEVSACACLGTFLDTHCILGDLRRDQQRRCYGAGELCGAGGQCVPILPYSSSRLFIRCIFIARARMGGPFGNRGSSESREQTIANGAYDPRHSVRSRL